MAEKAVEVEPGYDRQREAVRIEEKKKLAKYGGL